LATESNLAHSDQPNPGRRDFLYVATTAVGIVGVGAVAWPVINQMNPDASVLALSSTQYDMSSLEEGSSVTIKWRGSPVFVRHRTPEEIKEARDVPMSYLKDPQKDEDRVIAGHDQYLVMVALCTHLGCVPVGDAGEFGGWFCPCHGSEYDTSGRIRKGPAPKNLVIPPYQFLSDTVIQIG
jgi:ubiquinol-cytochrome c reductase iron-sulfur subunit